MSDRTDVEVVIGGKIYTLGGYESEEYLQKVASYINNKMEDCSSLDNFMSLPFDTRSVLLQLNIADDYFKLQKQTELLETEVQAKEKELFDRKHELIAIQLKLETAEKEKAKLEQQVREQEKNLIRLETELKEKRK